jgi:PAS domain S-box-containing protein
MLNFIDMDGRITWINKQWQEVLGWSLDEVRTLDIYRAAFPASSDRDAALRALRSRIPGWHDSRIRRKDGQFIDTAWAMVHLSDGTAIGIGQDIRERKRVEEELRASREQLRRLSARVDQAIEHERTELARELHDQLGQSLTALKIDITWLRDQPPVLVPEAKAVREKAAAITTAIDATIRDVRRISAGLRPVTLDRLGLLETIEWQTGQFERLTGVRCRFESHVGAVDLAGEQATQVFRILQEALTNTTRHANASRVSIVARARQGCFVLEIRDNGRGISDKALADPSALGLLGMRERALLAGGELTVGRAGRKGTIVVIKVPTSRRPRTAPRRPASHSSSKSHR